MTTHPGTPAVSLTKTPEPAPGPAPEVAAPEATAPGTPSRGASLRRYAVPAALLALPVGLAVLAGSLYGQVQDAREVAGYVRPSSDPLEAARTASRVLFSYDHRQLDEDFAAGAALSTGAFREEYARTTGAVVRQVAEEYDAVVRAEAVAAAVTRAEPGEVVAVVFVNQVTTSTRVDGEKIDQSRVRMTLVERGDRWLVRAVEAL